jgi:hypothetical protein
MVLSESEKKAGGNTEPNNESLSRKPLISALVWHPKNGGGIIRRAQRSLAAKSIGGRGVKVPK